MKTKHTPIQCRDFDDVIYALGGISAVARVVGCSSSAVCNWRAGSGRFPPEHYAVISMALYGQGFFAPWHLFRFTGIPPAATGDEGGGMRGRHALTRPARSIDPACAQSTSAA